MSDQTQSRAQADDSQIIYHQGGATTFVGHDAIALYRAAALASALGLYASCGMIPTRGVTISKMLAMASDITGKKYKRGDALKAKADVTTWVRELKAALPVVDETTKKGA